MTYASRPANSGACAYGRTADYHSHVSEGRKRRARPASGGAVSCGLRKFGRTEEESQELAIDGFSVGAGPWSLDARRLR